MNNSANEVLIQLQNVSKSYSDGKSAGKLRRLEVFNQINWQLENNQSVSIQGTSGSGKTTFLYLISGLDKPTSGKVIFESQDFNLISDRKKSQIRNQSIGFIYQFHHLIQELNIFDNIALPIQVSNKLTKQAIDWVKHLLNEVGLLSKKDNFPAELSGGQRQRVAIARCLVNKPKCIIADEPTGNLDQKNAENIANLLLKLQSEQGSLVIATHNNELARECQICYQLKDKNLISL